MLNTLAVLAYLLGDDSGLTAQMNLQASFLNSRTPQIQWSGVPPEADSLALIVKDKNSQHPKYYWVVYNLPANVKKLSHHDFINANNCGINSWGLKNYHAPNWTQAAKPVVIELFALDKRFSARTKMTGPVIEQKMQGHVLARAVLRVD